MKKLLKISVYTSYGFIVLLILLHLINREVNPTWQPISEYALGNVGWLMNIAFILLGIAFFALGLYFIQNFSKTGAKIGGGLLILSSFGNFLAGFFNTDPVGTLLEQMTQSGQIHGAAAGLLGLMILATPFILWQFYKSDALRRRRKPLVIITSLVWLSEIILVVSMAIYLSKTNGILTPDTLIGWPGRVVIVACALWIVFCSSALLKIEEPKVATQHG